MTEAIAVAVISAVATILTVILNGRATRNTMMTELDKQHALQQQEIQYIKDDISELKTVVKEHNGYAKAFNEASIATNIRLENLEKRLS